MSGLIARYRFLDKSTPVLVASALALHASIPSSSHLTSKPFTPVESMHAVRAESYFYARSLARCLLFVHIQNGQLVHLFVDCL